MERAINRKDFRREYCKEEPIESSRVEKKEKPMKQSIVLSKMMNVSLLLLSVLLLKFFGFEEEYQMIQKTMEQGMDFESVKSVVQKKIHTVEKTKPVKDIEKETVGEKEEAKEEAKDAKEEQEDSLSRLTEEEMMIQKYGVKPPLQGIITSGFGSRESNDPKISTNHTGIDIAASQGTTIVSAHSGKVIQAGSNGDYGNSVMIESGDLVTLYGHCSSVEVKVGDIVDVGQTIAKVGMTGNATGPHLHFEIRYLRTFCGPANRFLEKRKKDVHKNPFVFIRFFGVCFLSGKTIAFFLVLPFDFFA